MPYAVTCVCVARGWFCFPSVDRLGVVAASFFCALVCFFPSVYFVLLCAFICLFFCVLFHVLFMLYRDEGYSSSLAFLLDLILGPQSMFVGLICKCPSRKEAIKFQCGACMPDNFCKMIEVSRHNTCILL